MTKRYEVWFAIPSASVERCRTNLPVWREAGYRIAILQNQERGEIPADIVRWSDAYPGWSASINILCREVVPPSADIVVSGGDDMLPDPNHTAQELAEQFFDRFPDGFGVMQPHGDEYMEAKHYCGSPWLGRRFFETMYGGTGPMFPLYRHNWGDVELYWVARCLGALWERPDLSHFHAHFTRAGEKPPEWWTANVTAHDRHDVMLFLARKATRFPGCHPAGVQRVFDEQPLLQDKNRFAEKHADALYLGAAAQGASHPEADEALRRLADAGCRTCAIYGAGAFLKRLGGSLFRSPVEVRCVIDDNPALGGERRWNFPVVTREQALAEGVDAVLVCSDTHDDKMWDRCAPFAAAGARVERVCRPTDAEILGRLRAAVERLGPISGRIGVMGLPGRLRTLQESDELPIPVAAWLPWGEPAADAVDLEAIVLVDEKDGPLMWAATEQARSLGAGVTPLFGHGLPGWAPAFVRDAAGAEIGATGAAVRA